jgi:hypothetical protein
VVTVQHLVKKELDHNPVLLDLLKEGLLNITAVAEKIAPGVEGELRKKVKTSAVSMAIRRYVDELSPKKFHWRVPTDMEVSTRSQVYEVAIERTPEVPVILKSLYKEVDREKGQFISVIEGNYEFVVFTNQAKKQQIRMALHGQRITSETENLAYVSVNWKRETKDIPGIYYLITRALAFRGISIQSFHTIGSEMILFFKEDALMEAHRTIADIFRKQKTI